MLTAAVAGAAIFGPRSSEAVSQDEEPAVVAEAKADTELDSYYTFGDSFVLWDTFDITFRLASEVTLADLSGLSERDIRTLGSDAQVIRIPLTIRNISDNAPMEIISLGNVAMLILYSP